MAFLRVVLLIVVLQKFTPLKCSYIYVLEFLGVGILVQYILELYSRICKALKIRTKLTPKNSFGSRRSIGDLALAIIVPSILGSDPYVNCNAQLKTRIINFFMTILM